MILIAGSSGGGSGGGCNGGGVSGGGCSGGDGSGGSGRDGRCSISSGSDGGVGSVSFIIFIRMGHCQRSTFVYPYHSRISGFMCILLNDLLKRREE